MLFKYNTFFIKNGIFAYMKFIINQSSNLPLYKQVVAEIKNAVKTGQLKNGNPLPSLNDFAEQNGISMETTKKAYNILKGEGLVSGRQGKGYFIDIRENGAPKKILMLLDKLSAYKLAIHHGLSEGLSSPADITINTHNQDIELFGKMVEDSLDNYDYYIIAAHFPKSVKASTVARILKRIPNDRLILIDIDIPEVKGHIGRIYQDFKSDATQALSSGIDLIRNYRKVIIISSRQSLYGTVISPGIKKMLAANNIPCKVEQQFTPEMMTPGALFIVLCGQLGTDHFTIMREALAKGYTLGKAVGLISYNDEPVNEFICGGLTCISSDFEQMGKSAAEMINGKKMFSVHNPFTLVRRGSL